jgi:hypothetical protein
MQDRPWVLSDWTQADDSIRGGISYSTLHLSRSKSTVTFAGNVNTKILGAGFASQRTASYMLEWDLHAYDAIELTLASCRCSPQPATKPSKFAIFHKPTPQPCPCESAARTFTFIIKDTVLPKSEETGREKSGIVWEREFVGVPGRVVRLMFEDFRPFYRGKQVEDEGLVMKTETVRRFAIMFRSHFGEQEGDFSLGIRGIRAVKLDEDKS